MGTIASILVTLLSVLQFILLIYVILSWVEMFSRTSSSVPRISPGNPIVRFIDDVSNAILRPIRRVLEPYQRGYGIDFSPIVAFLLIGFLQSLIARLPF